MRSLSAIPPDLIVLPEAALTGYFLEGAVYDLALPAQAFARDLGADVAQARGRTQSTSSAGSTRTTAARTTTARSICEVEPDGERIVHVHRKLFLPTYGVFDEERFLSRGHRLGVFETRFGTMALAGLRGCRGTRSMPTIAAIKGARILLVPSASPGRGIEDDGELESITQLARDAALGRDRARHLHRLRRTRGLRGRQRHDRLVVRRSIRADAFIVQAPPNEACIVRADLDLREIDLARASLPLLGDLAAVLPDLLLDDELPLPRGAA